MGFSSRVGQIIYGALSLLALILILASIFTPGWRELAVQQQQYGGYTGGQTQPVGGTYNSMYPVVDMGLFQFACWSPNQGSMYSSTGSYTGATGLGGYGTQYGTGQIGTNPQLGYGTNTGGAYGYNQYALTGTPLDYCIQWWRSQPGYEKAVIALTIIAILFAIAAFLWNIVTFCQCGPKSPEHKPLPVLSGIGAVLLIIALIVFGANNSSTLQQLQYINQYFASGSLMLANIPSTAYVAYSFYLACIGAAALLLNTIVGALIACCDNSAAV